MDRLHDAVNQWFIVQPPCITRSHIERNVCVSGDVVLKPVNASSSRSLILVSPLLTEISQYILSIFINIYLYIFYYIIVHFRRVFAMYLVFGLASLAASKIGVFRIVPALLTGISLLHKRVIYKKVTVHCQTIVPLSLSLWKKNCPLRLRSRCQAPVISLSLYSRNLNRIILGAYYSLVFYESGSMRVFHASSVRSRIRQIHSFPKGAQLARLSADRAAHTNNIRWRRRNKQYCCII